MQIDDMQSGTGTTVNETNPSQEDFVATGRTCRVMVVDDSKTIRRTAETLLRKEGFEVVTAVDGFEALGKIIDYQPDVWSQEGEKMICVLSSLVQCMFFFNLTKC